MPTEERVSIPINPAILESTNPASGSVSTLTAIGHRAGYNSTGGYSVYVGRNAGEEETGAYGNTAVGNNAQVEQKIGGM